MGASIKIYLTGALIIFGLLTFYKQKVIDFFHAHKETQEELEEYYELAIIIFSVFYPPILIWATYLYFKEKK